MKVVRNLQIRGNYRTCQLFEQWLHMIRLVSGSYYLSTPTSLQPDNFYANISPKKVGFSCTNFYFKSLLEKVGKCIMCESMDEGWYATYETQVLRNLTKWWKVVDEASWDDDEEDERTERRDRNGLENPNTLTFAEADATLFSIFFSPSYNQKPNNVSPSLPAGKEWWAVMLLNLCHQQINCCTTWSGGVAIAARACFLRPVERERKSIWGLIHISN